ncbi:MAG: hypothetical protein AB1791_10970 [Chloroflexota bacterium]
MELRAYSRLFRRRWSLVVIPAVVGLLWGLLTYRPPAPAYNVGVRFVVGQRPSELATTSDEQRYYNWTTSEYVVNGLTDWVRGGNFAGRVSERLAAEGLAVAPGAIQAGLAADNVRSMLTLSVTYGDATVLERIVAAAIAVLQEENASALPQLGGQPAELAQLDQPIINPIPAGIRSQLDLPLRIGLALAAGFGLALLVDYLDPTLRGREEVEAMGLTIMGEIPRK